MSEHTADEPFEDPDADPEQLNPRTGPSAHPPRPEDDDQDERDDRDDRDAERTPGTGPGRRVPGPHPQEEPGPGTGPGPRSPGSQG
ncbi:hypothetical protein MWU57_01635 [Isoptericola sp. S6320L]|uniref:hypothetical protein n=1 Tax=Isoptericola sp. S6320L TaxID=2926411 RepID=UPI001FF32277|nr:hypothetical protein [Isoptericola sp. S6320L]MCK0115720.1 hypothetical protein [Isoptericola sp. S6320L]